MPPLPGAEPFRHEGGGTGVLICHGFTGSPQSVRPWADHLARRGLTVSLPLLPGHGTRWEDLALTGWPDWYAEVDRELRWLTARCRQVFVCGLSMGGALTLRLAARHGAAISGLVLVNPAIAMHDRAAAALPVLRHLVRSVPGIASDIARPGSIEVGYPRIPLHAAYSLSRFFPVVDAELPVVDQPVLLLRSVVDHVVPAADAARILDRITSTDVTVRLLERSYHVATLDHDDELIFTSTDDFISRLAPEAAPAETGTGGTAASDGA